MQLPVVDVVIRTNFGDILMTNISLHLAAFLMKTADCGTEISVLLLGLYRQSIFA